MKTKNNIITRISLSSGVAIALAVAAWLPSSAAEKEETEANDYTRSVARPYAQVLAAVKEAAQAQGFRVSNVHDIAASLRKDGIEREPLATVEVCNSKIAAVVLNAEPRLGSVMPCRITVFQQGKETVVTMILPSRLMRMFPVKPEVKQAAAEVDRGLKAIIDAATR
jgi:uncharacterized protein (DUF302 family)